MVRLDDFDVVILSQRGGDLARWLTSPLVYLDMLPHATPTPHRDGGDAASPPSVPAAAAS